MKKWIPFAAGLAAQLITACMVTVIQWGMRAFWSSMLEGMTPPTGSRVAMDYGLVVPILGLLGTLAAARLQRNDPNKALSVLSLVTAFTLILFSLFLFVLILPMGSITWRLS